MDKKMNINRMDIWAMICVTLMTAALITIAVCQIEGNAMVRDNIEMFRD